MSQSGDGDFQGTGRYRVVARLGAGAMGVVYEVLDSERNARVALKTLTAPDATAIALFKQEFRGLADVSHPNLATLYELESADGTWFFTMELVDGIPFLDYVRADATSGAAPPAYWPSSGPVGPQLPGSPSRPGDSAPSNPWLDSDDFADTVAPLIDRLSQTRDDSGRTLAPADEAPVPGEEPPELADALGPPAPLNGERLRAALRQLALGVLALHEAGKLHHDLKPSNVLIARDGRVVILDFGLVSDRAPENTDDAFDGNIVGTPAYMAPEQAAGGRATPSSDWYAVGAMLYEALTGRLPFSGSVGDILLAKQLREPPPPSRVVRDVPEDLDRLCADLLHLDPEDRPGGAEILARLGAAGTTPPLLAPRPAGARAFIGRDPELGVLRDAFDRSRAGRPVVVTVSGRSGFGKSALVRRFLDELRARKAAVVLAGRCYERESVPYKAFDPLVDTLERYLRVLPRADVEGLLPRDVHALARLFPVLERVPSVQLAPHRAGEAQGPELRHRAFAALKELFGRIADRKPLVLHIDDLQWADLDSLALFNEILRSPDPPAVLWVGSYRSEEAATSPFLQALAASTRREGVDGRELPVEALAPAESRALALALLGRDDAETRVHAERVARESDGNPFFIGELVRYVQEGHEGTDLSLADVLLARVGNLPDPARRLLEMVAVAGQPLEQRDVIKAAGLGEEAVKALAALRAARMVRTRGAREHDAVEAYHDRVRETVTAALDAGRLVDCHRHLAETLEATGRVDAEILYVHFDGARDAARAGAYAEKAATQAAAALAFDRAARLYRRALESRPADDPGRRELTERLADALANAGRAVESAEAFLAAAGGLADDRRIELRRRAAEQYLQAGYFDSGGSLMDEVLAACGVRVARTPRRALVALLVRRAQLRLRGLGFTPRDASRVPPGDLARIDTCFAATVGLAAVDVVKGAHVQARHLLHALRTGEPIRVARALVGEATHAATGGGRTRRRTEFILATVRSLTERMDSPYLRGIVEISQGAADAFNGRWASALCHCDRGAEILRAHCPGAWWEIDFAERWTRGPLTYLGRFREMGERLSREIVRYEERGNLMAVTMRRSETGPIHVHLALDRPDEAERVLAEGLGAWTRRGFTMESFYRCVPGTAIELYRGDAAGAWRQVHVHWPRGETALMLTMQWFDIEFHHLRARAALLAASRGHDRARALRLASGDWRRIRAHHMPWGDALAALIEAGLWNLRGRPDRAVEGLRRAVALGDATDQAAFAAAARMRLASLVGGDEGRSLRQAAVAYMTTERIRDPAAMTRLQAPGFSD